ncbi:hypothetical protein D3C81_906160 [compost metagenome]
MRLQIRQYGPQQRRLERLLKAVRQPRYQPQLAALNVRRQVHAVHDRQQRVGRAMHHQGRHPKLVQKLDTARLGQYRHDLALGPVGVERPVIGHCGLLQQSGPIVTYLWAAQCRQQVGLLFDGHLAIRRTAPCQQLHQRRVRCRQACRARAGHHQRQATHPFRRHGRQMLCDHPAHADTQHMKLTYTQCVHQPQPVTRHVGERVGRGNRQAELVAQQLKRQVGRGWRLVPARQTDIAVVIANDPKTLAAQSLDHIVRPVDQLPSQAHDQQQCRVSRRTDALVNQAQAPQVRPLNRRVHVTTLIGEACRHTDKKEEKQQKSPHERNTRMQIPSRARV